MRLPVFQASYLEELPQISPHGISKTIRNPERKMHPSFARTLALCAYSEPKLASRFWLSH